MAREEMIAKVEMMSNAQLLRAFIRVHDENMSKKSNGVGEPSGEYEELCYDEIEARMSGRR